MVPLLAFFLPMLMLVTCGIDKRFEITRTLPPAASMAAIIS